MSSFRETRYNITVRGDRTGAYYCKTSSNLAELIHDVLEKEIRHLDSRTNITMIEFERSKISWGIT